MRYSNKKSTKQHTKDVQRITKESKQAITLMFQLNENFLSCHFVSNGFSSKFSSTFIFEPRYELLFPYFIQGDSKKSEKEEI
jgi:hypothetical protein